MSYVIRERKESITEKKQEEKNRKPIKKCSYCGVEFELEISKKYIVKSRDNLLSCSYFDAMDCPKCGCQNIIWKRLEKVSENTKKTKK